jgi:hypothetical protein
MRSTGLEWIEDPNLESLEIVFISCGHNQTVDGAVAASIASSSGSSGFRSMMRPHSRKHAVSIGSICYESAN